MADRIVVMKSGQIQQVGTPEEVYDNPVNVFVASFIGAPSMNFLPARIEDDRLALAHGDETLPLALAEAAPAAGEVLLGIRPEHFQIVPEGQGLSAVIDLVEPLGSDTLIHCALAGQRVIARVSPDIRPVAGQRISLTSIAGKAHLFDPESQIRIGQTEGQAT